MFGSFGMGVVIESNSMWAGGGRMRVLFAFVRGKEEFLGSRTFYRLAMARGRLTLAGLVRARGGRGLPLTYSRWYLGRNPLQEAVRSVVVRAFCRLLRRRRGALGSFCDRWPELDLTWELLG